jgi:hypothetical protein
MLAHTEDEIVVSGCVVHIKQTAASIINRRGTYETAADGADLPALFPSGRKLRIRHVNAVCMKQPVPNLLGFTEFHLRQFGGVGEAGSLDLDQPLTDLGFMPVTAEHIFHESKDVVCHVELPATNLDPSPWRQVCGVKSVALSLWR